MSNPLASKMTDQVWSRENWTVLQKLRFFQERYGFVHAIAALAGRSSPKLWRFLGPLVTRRYLNRWLKSGRPKVINLGSGGNVRAEWLAADTDPRADVYIDVTRSFALPDDSVDTIFCEEVVEHLSFAQGNHMLSECYRCLKPDGVLRITTPDLSYFADILQENKPVAGTLLQNAVRITVGSESAAPALASVAAVNSIFYSHGHKFLYTAAALLAILQQQGFVRTRVSSYKDVNSPLGAFDSHADRFDHPPEMSLYIECSKPMTDSSGMGRAIASFDGRYKLARDDSSAPEGPASTGFQPGAVFIQGAGAIGLAMAMQRGLGFVATILAARMAGPAAFGAYSTALATAGMLAGYMGLGIGNSASRYIGRFPRDTHAYRKTLQAITSIATLCAILAGSILLAGAEPIATLVFHNENFSAVVQAAAIVVMALIFYEALNGILLGLLNFQHLFWLSSVSGVAMVVALVSASPYGSEAMIVGHGAALAIGMVVAICFTRALLRPLPPAISNEQSVHPREILLFGITQVGSGAGIALASWWVAVLVTWSDFSLEAMGYYGVGNQLRALATMMPSLISQMVLPLLARTGNSPREQEDVVRTSTFFCVASGFAFGGLMLLVLPLVLAVYGQKYEQATGAAALLIATAVVHIGGAPQAHALTVLSLRATALVNLAWTISLSLLAWFLVPAHGAAGAAGAWLLSHLGSQVLVHTLLRRKRRLPWGVARVWWLGTAAVLALSALACVKASMDGSQVALDSAQAILLIGTAAAFVRIGQREGFVPREMKSLILGLASIASTAFDIFGRTERKKIS